ncbi:tyrosine-type recombinase/integrase [Paenibacillus taichungensis]|uniref:site-specific integrase n=1 Tax=Paenibacillus taichungensis TaxID=484184 RepID=UPI00399FE7FA
MASGSIKKDPIKGTYYFIVDAGKKKDGSRNQVRRRGFKKKSEAQTALTEVLNTVNNGEYIEPSKIVFTDYMIETWLPEKINNNRMTRLTVDSYKSYVENHISPYFKDMTLSEIKPKDIKGFVSYLQSKKSPQNDKNLSPSTVQRIFNIVVTAFNFAVGEELIKDNPAKNVDRPKIPKRVVSVWNADQVKKFLKSFEYSRHHIAYYLAVHTGMRQGEILGLPLPNIDLQQKLIMVTQTLEHDAGGIKQGAKTSSGVRSISISDDVVEIIKKQIARIEEEKELAGDMYIDNGLLCCTNIGKPVFPDTLTKMMRRKIKELELPPIRFHDLRHTSASLMLMLGVHPKVVSERLGHSSVTITLDTYSHLLKNMQSDAADHLSNLLTDD